MGDSAFLVKLIKGFLEEGIVLVQGAVDAFTQGNAATIEIITHTLKSSSAYLGALHLSQLCSSLEKIRIDRKFVGRGIPDSAVGN
jgi:HPt (histidine-containing phosphotransfer) domain-containing protein